jgi:hypothetical protein
VTGGAVATPAVVLVPAVAARSDLATQHLSLLVIACSLSPSMTRPVMSAIVVQMIAVQMQCGQHVHCETVSKGLQ